jgi:hypothetical protein
LSVYVARSPAGSIATGSILRSVLGWKHVTRRLG